MYYMNLWPEEYSKGSSYWSYYFKGNIKASIQINLNLILGFIFNLR